MRSASDGARRRAAAAGLLLAALLLGVPLTLLLTAGPPHVAGLMDAVHHPATALRVFTGRSEDGELGSLMVGLAWLAWAAFAVSVVWEMLGRAVAVPFRLPITSHGRKWIAALVGSSMALVPVWRHAGPLRLVPAAVASASTRDDDPATVVAAASWSAARSTGGAEVAQSERTYVVAPGDTLWSIAERELGSPLRWRTIRDRNLGIPQPGGATLTSENWVLPGWRLSLPAHRPGSGGSGTAGGAPGGAEQAAGSPAAALGYGLLGAGVVLLVDRIRRARQRRRPAGMRITLPDGELAELERGLRASADLTMHDAIGRAMALWASGAGTARPVAWRWRPGEIELLPVAPVAQSVVTPPFRQAVRQGWIAVATLDVAVAGDVPRGSDARGVITVGSDGGAVTLFDVVAARTTSVAGDGTDMLLQSMVVELATLPWASELEVVVVGGTSAPLRALDRVNQPASIAAALAEVQARRHAGAMAPSGTVVVCFPGAVEAEPEAAQNLVALPGSPGGAPLSVVVAGEGGNGTDWQLFVDAGQVRVTRAGRATEFGSLAPPPTVPDLLERVDELLDTVEQPSHEPLSLTAPRGRSEGPREVRSGRPPSVVVNILGPVSVDGAERPFVRAWSMELLVYLCMHPGTGATTDAWTAALWPDRLMAPASVHSTASATRRALGSASDGSDHLPRGHGRLVLGPEVATDWDLFVRHAAAGDPDDWARALRLLRGRPFDGLRSADWTILEGHQAAIESLVVDVASRFAESRISVDPSAAEWAARQALLVSPYDERMYRLLIRAADAAGNPAGVESAMRELVKLVADDVEPYDAVHPDTLELYRALSRRTSQPSSSRALAR